jgi:pimeloyl-ACP methyl ester carboxylesterase
VGASMGGAITQEIAINHPERVLSAAILCSWARGDEITNRRMGVWAQAFQRFEPGDYVEFVFQLCFTHRLYEQAGALELFKQQSLANPFPQTPAGFQGQVAACSKHDTLDRLGQIKAPTLVWAGAEDILLPPRFSRQIAERIQGAEYYETPAAGHCFFYEQMEATGAKLLDWLQRVSQ